MGNIGNQAFVSPASMAYGSGVRLAKMEAGICQTEKSSGYTRKIVFASVVTVTLLATVCVLAAASMQSEEALATRGGKALKFGDSINLMNIFNEYIIVSPSGRTSAGGFDSYHSNNVLKILSPKGKKGAVNYGDKVVLMGPNGKYLFTRYNGDVSCRASIIATDAEFELSGGKGPVLIGNLVLLKSEYGYLTAKPDGVTALAHRATAMQKYTIGLPGSETGLRHANGITFGDTVMFQNANMEYLNADKNGWLSIKSVASGRWAHFVVLNPNNREGHITFGDLVVLRAHNGRMVRSLPNGDIQAVTEMVDSSCEFTFIGTVGHGSGIVHDQDSLAVKAIYGGLIDSTNVVHAKLNSNVEMNKDSVWKIKKVWTDQF